ncbi:MAG TPA: biopolymer transporter ExbD [Thermotogota bacterium]|nr:biopolymer transporter ExbD [Thermotogota bacterium]HRW93224.1 biopolymer transporter ExbD [Thermotogota bacterium]
MRRHNFEPDDTINITPLIDIIFILLLFFILTTTFDVKEQRSLDLQLPQAGTGQPNVASKSLEVWVDEEDVVYLSGKPASLEEVQIQLKNEIAAGRVEKGVILADANSHHGVVMEVLDLFRAEGVTGVQIQVEQR